MQGQIKNRFWKLITQGGFMESRTAAAAEPNFQSTLAAILPPWVDYIEI